MATKVVIRCQMVNMGICSAPVLKVTVNTSVPKRSTKPSFKRLHMKTRHLNLLPIPHNMLLNLFFVADRGCSLPEVDHWPILSIQTSGDRALVVRSCTQNKILKQVEQKCYMTQVNMSCVYINR